MATKNDVTGDAIISKSTTENYLHNWEVIFGSKDKKQQDQQEEKKVLDSEDQTNYNND